MDDLAGAAGQVVEIDAAELERRLLDPDVLDSEIRPYLVENGAAGEAFRPVVQADPNRVRQPETEAAVALASLNGLDRWRRLRRYRRRSQDGAVVRLVSEGDSWFQYPFLLTDVIDWLAGPYAILSLDAAGDLISDMVRQGELVTAVVQERPRAVLLSGGGNDLLGGANLTRALRRFEPGLFAGDYLGRAFEDNLRSVLDGYATLLTRLARVAPETPVITHAYDYAVPSGGRWLGQPMRALGITDAGLQRRIVREIVDRFHTELSGLTGPFPLLRVVDTRNSVAANQWHDELHPTDAGYREVAQRFATAIAAAIGTALPTSAPEAAVEAATAEGEPGGIDITQVPDAVLLREIGRRDALAQADDPLADSGPAVFPSSVAGTYPELEARGRTVVDAARGTSFAEAASPIPEEAKAPEGIQAALIRQALMRGLSAVN